LIQKDAASTVARSSTITAAGTPSPHFNALPGRTTTIKRDWFGKGKTAQ